jgi:quercetin dioxygenase-like cupin family protein
VNVHGDRWDPELDSARPGFSWQRMRVAAELLGASVYELPPGERTWPYHYHHGNEEWLVALAGTPTLRTPEGERELRPSEVVCFPAGPGAPTRWSTAPPIPRASSSSRR